MTGKSERLRKLEEELFNLEQWMKLGLVPKKDHDKFQDEIESIKLKISEEVEKIQMIKESGQFQEFVANKKVARAGAYADNPTVAEIDPIDDKSDFTDSTYHGSITSDTTSSTSGFEKDGSETNYGSSDDIYDDFGNEYTMSMRQRNRNRHGFIDPDNDEW